MHSRRSMLAASCSLLAISNSAESQDKRVAKYDAIMVPDSVELIGSLGFPLCTLVEFSGVWEGQQSKKLRASRILLKINAVNGQELKVPTVFPVEAVNFLPQTTGVTTREHMELLESGDKWSGMCYEIGRIDWIPDEVFKLPDVISWQYSRLRRLITEIVCVRVDLSYLKSRQR